MHPVHALAVAPAFIALLVSTAGADTINVPGDAPTIQAAFAMAVDGDEVVLADGVYAGVANLNLSFAGRDMTLRSASGNPLACAIDGGGGARFIVFTGTEGPDAVIEGIRFINGTSFTGSGGAIRLNAASPTITNCRFNDCSTMFDGGAIQINGGTPAITDCRFCGCSVNGVGGAIVCSGGSPTISGCVFELSSSPTRGGAVFCDSDGVLTIQDCYFEANTAGGGGAMYIETSTAIVGDSFFVGNTSTGEFPLGGGSVQSASSSVLLMEACHFEGDVAQSYGGSINIATDGTCTLSGCDFVGSSADRGGAVFAQSACTDIVGCLFHANAGATGGGGVQFLVGHGTVSASTFVGNVSGFRGGGLVMFGFSGQPSSIEVTACLFLGNEAASAGGGASAWSTDPCTFTNCVFSGNTAPLGGGLMSFGAKQVIDVTNCSFSGNVATDLGGAIHADTSGEFLQVKNSIFRGNAPNEIEGNAGAVVLYSNIEGGWSGAGANNDDADPMFVDPGGADGIPGTIDDDVRLQPGSPCIDAGNNELVPAGIIEDADGGARFVDDPATPDTGKPDGVNPVVDMGAYEVQTACATDTNGDGVTDVVDLVSVILAWGTSDPTPDVNGDGIVDVQDLVAVVLAWGACS